MRFPQGTETWSNNNCEIHPELFKNETSFLFSLYNLKFFQNNHLADIKFEKSSKKDSSEKIKKKKIKKKKDKIDLLKQINTNNIANLKKTNLKNTYINKIHHLINEDEKTNFLKDSNSESG